MTAFFFSYPEDDDELIVNSLLVLVEWLDRHPDCDLLINNGRFVKAHGTLHEPTHMAFPVGDPAMGLLKECRNAKTGKFIVDRKV